MKKHLAATLLVTATSLSQLLGQPIDLPKPNPDASVSYTIGYTEVKVSYGSPEVKERNIWGGVIPYDSLWTGGGDNATQVEFTRDVILEGQKLRAGKYNVFFVPGEAKWTVIFNQSATPASTNSYNEAEDVIYLSIQPRMNEQLQERLSYTIHLHETQADMAYIKLAWEKMRLYLRFIVNTNDEALTNLMDALEAAPEEKKWLVYAQGAQFMMDAGNIDQALEWATKSTDRMSNSWNWYIRARVEATKGDMQAAVASGTKSAELGLSNETDMFYKDHKAEVNSAIQSWAAKMN